MSWTVVPRAEIAAPEWDALVETSDEGWLWHRHGFQDVLATWPRRADRSFALVDGAGTIGAVVPAHLVSRRVGPVAARRLDVFGGPCTKRSAPSVLPVIRHALGNLARRERALWIDVSLSPLAPAWRDQGTNPLAAMGFVGTSGEALMVDLTADQDTLWRNVQSRTRTYIRSAARDGLMVRPSTAHDVDAYFALHVETCQRTGGLENPHAYFEAIATHLVPAGLAHGLVAERDGTIVAGLNLARYKDAACYWTAASSEVGQKHHANDVLIWHAMLWARGAGSFAFELGDAHRDGGTPKHRSIAAFKGKFGAATRSLHRGRAETANPLVRAILRLRARSAQVP